MALDFDDSDSLELGIALGVVLFKHIFHMGYGRNLQAEADCFYVGINPLALWNPTRSQRGAVP